MLSTDHVSASDFLAAVRYATVTRAGKEDCPEWLVPSQFAAAGSDEHGAYTNPHGGFLVPEHLAGDILLRTEINDPTEQFVRRIAMEQQETIVPARFEMNADTNRVDSANGGLVSPRRMETNTDAPVRNQFHGVTLNATTMSAVAYATLELLESTFGTFTEALATTAREQFAWMNLKEKLRGTGVGEPLGVLNAGCTIEVAKEDMQAADTINGTNIVNMAARCWGYERSIWLANPDCLPQLEAAHVSGASSDKFLLTPGSDMDGAAFRLCGRPLYFSEYCSTLGDKGDLVLGDWSQYIWGELKGFTAQESLHVRFIEQQNGFRFFTRNDGSPWWTSPLTPAYGASTLSPFVVLEARA